MKMMHPNSQHEIEVTENRAQMYRSQGWREITPDAPKANASLKVWQEFARSQGFTDDDLKGKKRDDLRAALA